MVVVPGLNKNLSHDSTKEIISFASARKRKPSFAELKLSSDVSPRHNADQAAEQSRTVIDKSNTYYKQRMPSKAGGSGNSSKQDLVHTNQLLVVKRHTEAAKGQPSPKKKRGHKNSVEAMNKTFIAKSPEPIFEGKHRTLEQYIRDRRNSKSPSSLSE